MPNEGKSVDTIVVYTRFLSIWQNLFLCNYELFQTFWVSFHKRPTIASWSSGPFLQTFPALPSNWDLDQDFAMDTLKTFVFSRPLSNLGLVLNHNNYTFTSFNRHLYKRFVLFKSAHFPPKCVNLWDSEAIFFLMEDQHFPPDILTNFFWYF